MLVKYSHSFRAVSPYAAANCFLLACRYTCTAPPPKTLSVNGPAMMVPGKLGFAHLNDAITLPPPTCLAAPVVPLPIMVVPAGAVTLMVAVKRSMPKFVTGNQRPA